MRGHLFFFQLSPHAAVSVTRACLFVSQGRSVPSASLLTAQKTNRARTSPPRETGSSEDAQLCNTAPWAGEGPRAHSRAQCARAPHGAPFAPLCAPDTQAAGGRPPARPALSTCQQCQSTRARREQQRQSSRARREQQQRRHLHQPRASLPLQQRRRAPAEGHHRAHIHPSIAAQPLCAQHQLPDAAQRSLGCGLADERAQPGVVRRSEAQVDQGVARSAGARCCASLPAMECQAPATHALRPARGLQCPMPTGGACLLTAGSVLVAAVRCSG